MEEANKSKRIVNVIVDNCIIFFIYTPISLFAYYFLNLHEKIYTLVYFFIVLVYYGFFETYYQQTLGKMLTKTKVVTLQGEAPSIWKIFIRTIVRYNPFDVLSYLFGLGKGQHDYFSKTIVVDCVVVKK